MVFTPDFPDTANSLNRARIAQSLMPDFPVDVRGKSGYELISQYALATYLKDHTTLTLQDIFDGALVPDAAFRFLGRNLGYLLLMLHRGDTESRRTRPDWDGTYWQFWHKVRTIYLGGGLLDLPSADLIASSALDVIGQFVPDYWIQRAENPRYLSLLGAARTVYHDLPVYCFDFGGSFIKRAIAYSDAGMLYQLSLLPTMTIDHAHDYRSDDPQTVLHYMAKIISDTLEPSFADVIPISIAAYVTPEGEPRLAQGGIYMHLAELDQKPSRLLSDAVSKRIGQRVTLRFLHDGSAAANVFTPLANTAVLTLGTAIGAGYPVPRGDMIAVSPHITITTP